MRKIFNIAVMASAASGLQVQPHNKFNDNESIKSNKHSFTNTMKMLMVGMLTFASPVESVGLRNNNNNAVMLQHAGTTTF